MKLCNTCGETKEGSEFGVRKASNDGLSPKCKSCASEYDKKRANLPKRIKLREDYAKTERGIAAGNKAKYLWTKRNEIKRGASTMVGNAVRDGVIEKQNFCSVCGANDAVIHGHHDDYSKPLSVRWLCSPCHNEWHNKNGEALNG